MIRLHGQPKTTAGRSIWALEELGLPYEQVPVDLRARQTRTPAYLALNPNGRIPTLVDGDVVLYESMAINFYLVRRYGGHLRPRTPEAFDQALMWSFWTISETETPVRTLVRNRLFLHEHDRDADAARSAESLLSAAIGVLDRHLRSHAHVLGDAFTIADVNVAHGLTWLPLLGLELERVPALTRWLAACVERPAFLRMHGGPLRIAPDDRLERGAPDPRRSAPD